MNPTGPPIIGAPPMGVPPIDGGAPIPRLIMELNPAWAIPACEDMKYR